MRIIFFIQKNYKKTIFYYINFNQFFKIKINFDRRLNNYLQINSIFFRIFSVFNKN